MFTYTPTDEHLGALNKIVETDGVPLETAFNQLVYSALEQVYIMQQQKEAEYLRQLALTLPPESQALVAALIVEEAAKMEQKG